MCDKLERLKQFYIPGNYEKTSQNLMNAVNWDIIPVDIKEILSRLNIPFYSKDFNESESELQKMGYSDKIQGMIHVEGEDIDIFYNNKFNPSNNANEKEIKSSEHKINFTLAHELAHSILHAQDISSNGGLVDLYRSEDTIDVKEIEANTLAGEILMPRKPFVTFFNVCISDNKTIQETINSLSILFNVSENVVKARINYLGLDSNENVVKARIKNLGLDSNFS